ncbi:MAG: ATP-binding protein [Vicinamibacterales bacterium]
MSPARGQLPLRSYLVLLGIGAMLPFFVVSGALLMRVLQGNRDSVERTLVESARQQAVGLDAEMAATIRTLESVAASPFLDRNDLSGFEDELRRLTPTQPWLDARLIGLSPVRLLINTGRSPGVPPGDVVDPGSIEAAVASRRPTVAPVRRSPLGLLGFAVRVPVVREGQVRYLLTAVVTPTAVADVIGREALPRTEWTRTVVDTDGMVVARTREPERFVGQQATAPFKERTSAAPEGFYQDTALDGQQVYVAFSHARLSGWTSAVVVPVAFMDGPLRRSIGALVAVALFVLAVSGSAAYWLAGRIASELGAATDGAEALAEGRPVNTPPSIVAEVTRLVQALERTGHLLTERSAERDRNLAQAEGARAEAEEASRAKDQFLAMLGHELRNPLSPIVTALALLRMRGTPWTREHVVIERQVTHMSRLVNDLLDVSRITRGTLELRREPIEMADVITRATDMAEPRLEERRHSLEVDVPEGLRVTGDEVRLAQVFGNLLSNAATYTPDGGSVRVRAERRNSEIAVEVSDTGRGISPDVAPRIFDLFVQGPRAIDRREGGLGLGLAIAKSLVELHDGRIEAHSAGVNRGSTFTVVLPAASTEARTAEAVPVNAPLPSHPLRVLVVDDNADAAEMLATLLAGSGHDVRTASDGPQALDILDTFRADVTVLDIGLPVMDGYELARRIHDRHGTEAPVLIAVTGYGQVEDAERSRQAGIAHHLVKPVDGDDLLRLLADTALARATHHA